MEFNYPPGYSFFKTYQRAVELVNNPLESIIESVDRFGNTYSVYSGFSRRMILTQDPLFIDHILKKNHKNYYKSEMVSRNLARFLGKGLLTSNGSHWLKQRRLIQPGFHLQKIQALYGIMQKTTDEFLKEWPTGKAVEVYPLMNKFAFELVINTLFDIELPLASRVELGKFVSETQEFVIRDIRQPHKRWWHKLSGEVKLNLKKAATAREIIRSIIRTRKSQSDTFNDLLEMLLNARYEDTGLAMAEEQVIDEILVLIIAGHETTANALSWTLYLLASNTHVQQMLRDATREASPEQVVRNEYLNAVINESMRLYPPAWASDRVALDTDTFGDWTFPKGTVIVIFYYGLHRNPAYWEEALQFKPERFLTHDDSKEKPKVFYPFGAGPRLCIGNNFAIGEMAIFLRSFIHTFDIAPSGAIPKVRPLITLRPEGISLTVSRPT